MKALEKQSKYLNKQSSAFLSEYALSVMANLANSIPPFRISLDYFRYSQWQDSSPYLWNIDYYTGATQNLFPNLPAVDDSYWDSNTMFDLEYCNWNKDLFMGILPDTQFGDVATVLAIFFLCHHNGFHMLSC